MKRADPADVKQLTSADIARLRPGAVLRLPCAQPSGRRVLVGRQEFWFENARTQAWQKNPLAAQHVRALCDGGYGPVELEADGNDDWLSEAQSAMIVELSSPESSVVALMPSGYPVVLLDGVSSAPVWINEKGEWGLAFTAGQSAALREMRWRNLLGPHKAPPPVAVDETRIASIVARIASAPPLESFASDNAEYYRWYLPGGIRRAEPLTAELLKDYLVQCQMYTPYEAELAVRVESLAVTEDDVRYLSVCRGQSPCVTRRPYQADGALDAGCT